MIGHNPLEQCKCTKQTTEIASKGASFLELGMVAEKQEECKCECKNCENKC